MRAMHNFLFVINTTAYHLGQYSLLLKSSMVHAWNHSKIEIELARSYSLSPSIKDPLVRLFIPAVYKPYV